MKNIIPIIAFILAAATATAQIGHWEKLNPKNNPGERQMHGLAGIGLNKVLLFGGTLNHVRNNETWIFDLDKEEWQQIQCKNKPSARYGFNMEQISEKRVLLLGGTGENIFSPYNDLWYFDLDSMDWYKILDSVPVEPTERPCMAALNDEEILIYGGYSYDDDFSPYFKKTYIYNFKNNTKEAALYNPDYGRYNAYCSSINENEVLMYGGWSNLKEEETWIFNRKNKRWKKIQCIKPDKLNTAGGDLVKLASGLALLFGGAPYTDKSPFYPYDYTWIFEYDKMEWRMLDLETHPSGRGNNRMCKINEKGILLYGGNTEIKENALETWLFVIDTNITSIEDNANKLKFTMKYITENEIYFEYCFENPLRISIANINGIIVYSEEISAIENYPKTSTIPIDYLPSGIYFFVVNSGGDVLCEKVIIAK